MGLFEEATKIVSVIGLFSSNESYEEIPTNDLKYFLLPYFLGNLALKLCGGDRNDIIRVVEVYFRDFLQRSEVYSFMNKKTDLVRKGNETRQPSDEFQELTQMAHDRNYKLKKFQEKKELQELVKQLKMVMDRDQDDDSTKREYYLNLIKMSINEMEDELSSLETEKRCLAMMALRDKDGLDTQEKRPKKPMQTVIITKDAAMKAVYGAGYPSLPVLSVDEFYEQRVAEGIFPDPTVVKAKSSLQDRLDLDEPEEIDKENAEKERRQEQDDEELLARARAMDEFHDNTRRGDGNRHNRS